MTPDSIIHLVSVILIAFIGILAYRSGISKTQGNAQDNTIRALQGEMSILKDRVEVVEKANHKLTQTISLIKSALSQRGMIITIDGDLVTITDTRGSSQSARIQEAKE